MTVILAGLLKRQRRHQLFIVKFQASPLSIAVPAPQTEQVGLQAEGDVIDVGGTVHFEMC
ncbi:hypothetical protein [Photorhabdus antumapuensis]|uniref:hypothetical protein n=1 Tax=Photorhabdus antumapuensis TaxID=2862867 RepID=UPI001CEC572A|nr:hypothetical protein [Photorhabdus antumapuensis]MCA6221859.1 hypothetical protein [Photorhabdus antumapuensis]